MADDGAGDGSPPVRSFPYACTPEPRRPWYARYRAEGRSPLDCACHGLHYLVKYRRKWAGAPAEEGAHFREQHGLLRALAREPGRDGDVGLAMVGDVMWMADGWDGFLADEVLDHLGRHDVVLGNLETAISDSFRVSRPFPEFAWFNAPPALLTAFRRPDGRNAFTALAVANNHRLDYRDQGVRDTLRFLDHEGIRHAGVRLAPDEPAYITFEAGGLRIGLYAACWGPNSPRRAERSALTIETLDGLAPESEREPDLAGPRDALAAMADDRVTLRVVYLHWGFEYELYPTPRQVRVAREIVRAGADIVFGSHPHVPQPAEVCFLNGYEQRYPGLDVPRSCLLEDAAGRPRKALVCYSLGNFTTAMSTFLCRVGLVQSLSLRREPETGGVDWHRPRGRLVYNVPKKEAAGQRRLVLLGTWLAEHPDATADDLAFLRDHVVAEP
ncbi:MAG: CapA family protein [Planctomycetota bacterium]